MNYILTRDLFAPHSYHMEYQTRIAPETFEIDTVGYVTDTGQFSATNPAGRIIAVAYPEESFQEFCDRVFVSFIGRKRDATLALF